MLLDPSLSSTDFTVVETTPTGETFATVVATDDDELGDISYRLSSTSSLFTIDNSTGQLQLLQTLDYETE